MPFTAENQEYLKKYFDSAFAKYKANLCIYKEKLKNTNLQRAILIEQEIASGEIWNNIQAAVFAYCNAAQTEEEIKTKTTLTNAEALTIAKASQEKEKSINDFAEQIKKLINLCNVSFTAPDKDYIFWGNDAGEEEAYRVGLPNKANVVSAQSNDIFQLLLGPMFFDPTKKDYTFNPATRGNAQYVLQQLLYKQNNNSTLKDDNLPDCSSLLWAAMSKLFVERAAQAVEKAVETHKILPNFIVYLPSQINRDGNFWLWELPVIQRLAQKINIIYKKIDLSQDKWVETSLEDYHIYLKTSVSLKTQVVEKKFHGESYFEQNNAITIQKLRKYVQKWKEYTGDKDRERDLSVMLNVLHGKTKTDKTSKAYQDAGKNSQEDEKNNKALDDRLNKIFHGTNKFDEARKIVLGRYYRSIEIDINLCYGAGTINLKKLPTTLSGQLRLMQIAKQYHQHQFIIDIFKQGKLKNLTNTKQAQEIYLWAINRRIENTLKLHIATTETLQQDFKSSGEIETEIKGKFKNNSVVDFERARRLGLLAKFDAANKDEHVNNMLQIYKDNLFKHHDPASGAKYLQEYSDRIKQNNYIISADSSKEHVEYRSVAERTFDLIDLYGIDECTEFSLLRTAFLSALVLKNTEKLQAIKKRMLQVEIPNSELDYVRKMNIYQINQDGSLSPVELSKNKDFIDIDNAQKEKKWQKLQLENSKDQDLDRQFWRRSYDYRQSFNHYYEGYLRGGNIRYGGVLPQQLVSKGDIDIFNSLLEIQISQLVPSKAYLETMITKLDPRNSVAKTFFQEAIDALYKESNDIALQDRTLQDLNDPKIMLRITRYIVALNFQAVADSYDPDKAMYRQLDYTVNAMNRLMGGKEHYQKDYYDSATSLSIMYALRVGDCRHHAESMQLFFDIWKRRKLLQALNASDADQIKSLNGVQLRVIDTKEEAANERTQKRDFVYSHSLNVLREVNSQKQYEYTVFDAFALNQDPEKINLTLKDDEISFETKRKVGVNNEAARLKFASYSGDKGVVKPTNNLSLLGRSGIKVDSIRCAIIDNNTKEKIQKTATDLAIIEKQRCREEMSLDELFEMYIIKGYVFDEQLTLPTLKDDDVLFAGVMQFLRKKDYPKLTETVRSDRIHKFIAEIKSQHSLIYTQLTRQYVELIRAIENLHCEDDAMKKIVTEIQEDAKSLIASCSELSSQDIESKLTKFRTKLYDYHAHPAISKHHEIYKPILANIGIILTGVGILAILIKVAAELTRSLKMNSKISINNMFFFSNTASQDKIEDIDKAAKQIILKPSA